MTITKSSEYYAAMAAWCCIGVPDVGHAMHPYTCFLPLRPKDCRRRRAAARVPENAPINATDAVFVRPPAGPGEEPTVWLRRTSGPLKGWFAALTLSRRAFITYSEAEARVTSTQNRRACFPLPPGARVRDVEAVPHEGKPRPWPAELADRPDGPWVEMRVRDSGGRHIYYRVRYSLPGD